MAKKYINNTIIIKMNLQKIYKILKTSEEEIKSSKRNKEIAFNRHIICYFLYNNGVERNLITKIESE